jgi:ABC-2 type transport system permease protein
MNASAEGIAPVADPDFNWRRYPRLYSRLGLFTLVREMSFRGNFLVKMSVEVLWLGIMLAFYETVFARTNLVAGWSKQDYLFFVGCYFALNGVIETLFLENCNEFSNLVRTGDLDFLLLKPIDEQFLITCRRVDWSVAPNILMGFGVMGVSLWNKGWAFDPLRVGLFAATFACGVAIAYAFMLVLTSFSVWLVRNQSLMEMWWLFSSLARFPREIFQRGWAYSLDITFTFVLPILLVVNVPAQTMVRVLDPWMIAFIAFVTVVSLWASRQFFHRALRSYRSASS